MTSIERTAYPRLKRRPSAQELADVYTPTVEDLAFIRATARGPSSTLTLAVLLKVFQRLGHLPRQGRSGGGCTPTGRSARCTPRRRPADPPDTERGCRVARSCLRSRWV